MSPNHAFGSPSKKLFLVLTALFLMLTLAPSAQAVCTNGTAFWRSSAGSGAWSTAGNWGTSPARANRVPCDGDSLNFGSGAGATTASNDNNTAIAGITFAGGN